MGMGLSAHRQYCTRHGVALSESVPGAHYGIWIGDGGLTSAFSRHAPRAAEARAVRLGVHLLIADCE